MSVAGAIATTAGCPSGLEPAFDADIIDPAPFVRYDDGTSARLELLVHGAHCGGCISKIESGLAALPSVTLVRLNLSTGKLVIQWNGAGFAPIKIIQSLNDLGYRAMPFDPATAIDSVDKQGRFILRCLAVAGFATANIMLLSVAVWAGNDGGMSDGLRGLMHWVASIIAVPAALYAGQPFFRSAWGALKAGHANMDVPISLAVILALGVSIAETINHGRDTYFDAAVMLLFFLLVGRYLDHRLRARSRAAARDLLALQAVTANRITAHGNVEAVTARQISPGDHIILAPGDRAPVNGEIIEGTSMLDMSLVMGESAPVEAGDGKPLYAGVVNLTSRLIMRATARAEDSLVADLARLIEAGEQSKSRYIRLADRAAALYVPIVHSLALATFLGWFFIGDAGLRLAVMNAVAVLIITCPCALGLAAPAVQVVATGRLFNLGILVKSGDALERLAETDTFVFDKTGTLTQGKLTIANLADIDNNTINKAAMLARASRHPLARAIARHAGAGPVANEIAEVPSHGIEGIIDGTLARLGRAEWVGSPNTDVSASTAWFSHGDAAPILFEFADAIRTDAGNVIEGLEKLGVAVEMLSGDRAAPARRIANTIRIDNWRAEYSPADKIARLDDLKQQGRIVAMIGDGLNDAPALASAHASLSPGSAADASQASADFVFQGEGLAPVLTAYEISKKARRRVLENFSFAALYNACAIPLAVFGFVTPLIAALAMSGSSIIVTINALRLAATKREAPAP